MVNVETFFATARERYRIKLLKDSGRAGPWTDDPIFRDWFFCNVFREDDKTTVWFRENVRQHLDGLRAIEATVCFRWFNFIPTGEKVVDLLLNGWDSREALRRLAGAKQVMTGAYQITSPKGMPKLEGLLHNIDVALPKLPYLCKWWGKSLRRAWCDLSQVPFLGTFHSYEMVSDLRWTPVLNQATDINTWAHAGPGCAKGLGFVAAGRMDRFDVHRNEDQSHMRELMRELLHMSRDPQYWPAAWPTWEMREVEHWLCETSKYVTAQSGARLKRRYRPAPVAAPAARAAVA
jgi:hypothetical protein